MIDTAIILAAGLGTRLAPLSGVRAKAALPVAGETLIRRQIRWLAAAGVTKVIVNLHHLPATITSQLGHGEDLGVSVRYSWEPVVLGSAGGPRRAFDLVDADRCVIVNGDTLTDLDLAALDAAHDASGALVTLAGAPGDLTRYNALLADLDGTFAGVALAGSTSALAVHPGMTAAHFVGVQVADRRAFEAASPDVPSASLRGVYPELLARRPGSVRVWTTAAAFRDIGTPADYHATVLALAAGEGRTIDRGVRVEVSPSATLTRVVCWDDVHVGPDAHLRDCVLADGVRVPAGARLERVSVVPRAACRPGPDMSTLGDLVVAPFGVSPAAPARG